MNCDRIEGNWKQLKGSFMQHWGKLTLNEVDVMDGKREELSGKMQEIFGISKDEAEEHISSWEDSPKKYTSSH